MSIEYTQEGLEKLTKKVDKYQKGLDIEISDVMSTDPEIDDGSELICVQNPSTEISSRGDGLQRGFFLIREARWERIKLYAQKMKQREVTDDHSNDQYTFVLKYNVYKLIKRCIVYKNLGANTLSFIRNTTDNQFIVTIRENIRDDYYSDD